MKRVTIATIILILVIAFLIITETILPQVCHVSTVKRDCFNACLKMNPGTITSDFVPVKDACAMQCGISEEEKACL